MIFHFIQDMTYCMSRRQALQIILKSTAKQLTTDSKSAVYAFFPQKNVVVVVEDMTTAVCLSGSSSKYDNLSEEFKPDPPFFTSLISHSSHRTQRCYICG